MSNEISDKVHYTTISVDIGTELRYISFICLIFSPNPCSHLLANFTISEKCVTV